MSNPNDSAPPQHDELQFDEAEFTEPAHAVMTCTACKTPIADLYYEAGGTVVCEPCQHQVSARFHGGSRLGRAFKAFVLGTIAAVAGAVLFYAISKITGGRGTGLVAICAGLIVGGAVKAGSGNRGGRFYQLMAVFLTYSAIVAMLVPVALAQFQAQEQKQNAQVQEMIKKARENVKAEKKKSGDKPEVVAPKGRDAKEASESLDQTKAKNSDKDQAPKAVAVVDPRLKKTIEPTTKPAGTKEAPEPAGRAENLEDDPEDDEEPDLMNVNLNAGNGSAVLVLIIVAGILAAYAFPIFLAFGSPILGVIFGFALWEAWKINRKVRLVINGPFHLAADHPQDLASEDLDHEQ